MASEIRVNSINNRSGLGTVTIADSGIVVSGILTATSFYGDASNLTGIDATALKDSGGNVKVQANTSGIEVTGIITATSFVGDGSGLTGAGSTVADDTTTNAAFYPVFTQTTSGTITASKVSTSKLSFNPSTGTLTATTLSGTVSGGNVSGNISGNAANITAYTVNQSVGTSNNVQFNSIGAGTAASGTAGEIRATNNVTAYYSDDRLKTRIGNIENAIDKVCSLNGFYYEANKTAQDLGYKVKREVGVSAQEVQSILPEIIAPAPIDEKYMTVYYERLVPLLIEAIKEQQATINNLIERTSHLEEKCH